ncbi:uncharacterized protein LOC144169052 [Haemaphysalis longicornis]
MDIPSTIYFWMFKGHNGHDRKNITLHIHSGLSPDKPVFSMNDDTTLYTADLIYTDYKDCVIMDFPFKGLEECMMWITKDLLYSIPQHCLEQFDDICPAQTWIFDQETCGEEYSPNVQ